jgi:hypothetical protein
MTGSKVEQTPLGGGDTDPKFPEADVQVTAAPAGARKGASVSLTG